LQLGLPAIAGLLVN